MEVIYNIVVPIFAALIGGTIGGLFTFLGIRMLLVKDKKLNEEVKLEKNRETNQVIKANRPELLFTHNPYDIIATEEMCLLPYVNPELEDKNIILFNYSDEIFDKDYWDKYEIILENSGKREIKSIFLLLQYKCGANIYSKDELLMWENAYIRNYYSDELNLCVQLKHKEKIKLIIYYPKGYSKMEKIPIDAYMRDEDDNYWCQNYVNCECPSKSELISPDTFCMHLQQEYYQWFIYDHMYYASNIKKNFADKSNMQEFLENRKKECWDREKKQKQFVYDVNAGKIVLNHDYPITGK